MCARVEWLIICINYLSVYAGAEELFAISTQGAINYVLIVILGTHEHISHAVCKPCRRGWGLIPVVVSRHVVQDVLSCGERGRARDGADPYDSSRHDSQSHRKQRYGLLYTKRSLDVRYSFPAKGTLYHAPRQCRWAATRRARDARGVDDAGRTCKNTRRQRARPRRSSSNHSRLADASATRLEGAVA